MKDIYTNKLAVAILAISLGFLSSSASARDDGMPSRMQHQVLKLQQQIKAAEANKQATKVTAVVECKKLEEQGKKC